MANSEFLATIGCEVSIALLKGPVLLEDVGTEAFAVHNVNAHPREGLIKSHRRVAQTIKQSGPDIVQVHSFFGHLALALAFPRKRPFALISTLHNLGYDAWPASTAYERTRKKLHGSLINKADCVVAVSAAVKNHYIEHLSVDVNRVIPDPVLKSVFEVASDNRISNQGDHKLSLVLPGRVTREKGHSIALKALAILRERGCEATLEILGGGPLESEVLREASLLGLENLVTLTGSLPHDQLLSRTARADFCLVPSLYEGLGIVALEAMALGVPVIASAAGGLSEIVCHEENGLLVKTGDPNELAEACLYLRANPNVARRISSAAKEWVSSKYHPDLVGRCWQDLHQELIFGRQTS